ncbi:MAG: tryptophan synthase subunit alpha [Thermodesulfobacteriota bacterium]
MGRIEDKFKELKDRDEKALITFITAGDPDLPTTSELILCLERAGADIIELGIPFSDPMADGSTIQAASERALKNKTSLRDVLALVKEIRAKTEIPIVLFGYYNPIFAYGTERFAEDAGEAGVDGVLVVDLPPEEADELKVYTDRAGLDFIFLVTPTSNNNRMKLIADKTKGFVYYVSVTGVTGARGVLADSIKEYVARTKEVTDCPVGVGFGISTPEQAGKVARWADGVVVGSAIVKLIEESNGTPPLLMDKVGRFVKELKKGMQV